MITRAASFGKRSAGAVRQLPQTAGPVSSTAIATLAIEGNPGVIAQLPWLTFVLCVTLIFKFNTELRASVDYSAPYIPGHFSLLALGASSRSQILGAGEWWRLFTAPVLHASPSHLIGNLIALLVAGWMLEPLVGIGWFGAIYFLGGFSGAFVSMLQNAADAQSVGASGAIMSCLACMFALSFHDGVRKPKLMRQLSGALLFPALRSSVSHGAVVDISAHLGGMIAGILLAFTLLMLWPENKPQIPGRNVAALIAGGFIALTVMAFSLSSNSYDAYAAQAAHFIPQAQLRSPGKLTDETTQDLITKYPDDPRGHMLRAIYFLTQHDFANSESQLQKATQLAESYRGLLPAAAVRAVRASLAIAIAQNGSQDEGRRVATPLCSDAELETNWQQKLAAVSLCGARK